MARGFRLEEQGQDGERGADGCTYRVNISDTISTSVSAAEIFSAEDILGGPPKRKDIVVWWLGVWDGTGWWEVCLPSQYMWLRDWRDSHDQGSGCIVFRGRGRQSSVDG